MEICNYPAPAVHSKFQTKERHREKLTDAKNQRLQVKQERRRWIRRQRFVTVAEAHKEEDESAVESRLLVQNTTKEVLLKLHFFSSHGQRER